MGIERFFNSILQNKIIKNKENNNDFVLQNKIAVDYIYIDFNSILYKVAYEIEKELNHLLYDIIYNDIIYKNNPEDKELSEINNVSQEIIKKWNYKPSNYSLEEFKNYFTEDLIDKFSIIKVKYHLEHMISNIIDGSLIKKIIISMDGVPNMAKIVEQKKRRYNLYIINKLKKELYKEYKDKLDEKRRLFEENRYGFNRNKILAWHSFMKKVSQELTDSNYLEYLKNKYVHLEEFIFSGADIPGEGEKKIMEYILNNNDDGKYIIYSPDSDVVILSIILANKKTNSHFYMLHYEQNKLEYTIIDINKLIENIYSYINDKVGNHIKGKLDINNITDDIAVLFSMFGNDFIPRIESLDVRKDFMIIINKYCDILDDSNPENIYYITYTNNNLTRINYQSLRNFMGKMSDIEYYLIKDTYMANNYNNYKKLKDELRVNNLYIWLINYIHNMNSLLDNIYSWIEEINNKLKKGMGECHILIEPYIKELYKKQEEEFIKDFLIIENKKGKGEENKKEKDQTLEEQFMEKIKSYFIIDNNTNYCKVHINLKLKLRPFDNDIENKFHQENLEKLKVNDFMEITEYDKDHYLMERMMGRFKKNLNAINKDVGKVVLSIIKKSNTKKYYKITTTPYEKENTKDYLDYYSIYFNDKPNSEKIDKSCEEYLTGLFWVTDFYFNKNDFNINLNFVSTWFYKSHRPPLIREIAQYLYKNKYLNNKEYNKQMKNLANNSIVQLVKRDDFFNSKEHYYYITPKNSLNEKNNMLIKDNEYSEFYPDLDKLVKEIYQSSNNNIIDCSTATYINKCNLLIEPIEYKSFYKFIQKYRDDKKIKIEYQPFTKNFIQRGGKENYVVLLNNYYPYIQNRYNRNNIIYKIL
jgi:5'-3' exonuclease